MTEIEYEEGYWRQSESEMSPLPWPTPDPGWSRRKEFLGKLEDLEVTSFHMDFMGYSRCRLCGRDNGASEFKASGWIWPEGYRHYIADHGVRPSVGFEEFILGENSRRN